MGDIHGPTILNFEQRNNNTVDPYKNETNNAFR